MTPTEARDGVARACSCCAEVRSDEELTPLGWHPEVALFSGCIGWLHEPSGDRPLRSSVPILVAADPERALAHYRTLGFETEAWEGGGYGFVSRDGVQLHLSELDGHDPSTNPISC